MDIIRIELKRFKLWGKETGFVICDEAKNGHDALLKLETNPVDLVITDIKMPKIDGLELLKKIAEKNYCSCVVLMSDYSDFSYVKQGLVLGAFDYILKPVEEVELNKTLKRAKGFILGRKKEEERLKKFELESDKNLEKYVSKVEVKQLIKFVCEGNEEFFNIISETVNNIGGTLKYNLAKIEKVLRNILLEIKNKLLEEHLWFEKFYNLNDFVNINFSQCSDFDSIKEQFLIAVKKCILKINKLQCGRPESIMVEQVCKYVLENVEGDVSLKFVADRLFMNKTYISEAFKQKTGIPFVEYITTVKIERAIKLIEEDKYKVYEIGYKLGFKDIEYFSKIFKKYTGLSPTQFRYNTH